jgi:hypothetical protein
MTSPQTLAAVRPPVRSMESVLKKRWARLFIPSLSDLFFVAILGWVFMSSSSGWQGLLEDGDVGWHIRTGEYVLDHHSVPHHDLYSFSKPGAAWYAWEWLSDVIDASLFRLAGLKGIVLLAGVIIAIFATTLLRRMVWRGSHLFVAIVIALMAVGSSSIHFLARPHVFTMLLLSISVWMIEADRKSPSNRIWLLVPITIVWTNLHGGFLSLIAVLGLTAIGMAVEGWLARGGWRGAFENATRYGLLTAACAAASLVNPYGYGLHVHVGEYLRSDWIRSVVQEFQSPSFRSESMLQFEALMLVGLIVAGLMLKRRRIVEPLWIIAFTHMSLGSVRHVPVFVTVVAPILAAEIAEWWKAWTADAGKGSILKIVNSMAADSLAGFRRSSAWPAIVVGALIVINHPIPWPKDFPSAIFPVEMAHQHAAEILNSRLITTDQWADFLIFTNPEQKVFVDGRSDFYGPEVGNQYIHVMNGHWDWQQVMTKYGFTAALLPVESALSQLLKLSPDWRIVVDDGKRIFLVRRSAVGPNAAD